MITILMLLQIYDFNSDYAIAVTGKFYNNWTIPVCILQQDTISIEDMNRNISEIVDNMFSMGFKILQN